jgi:hypothetical protein
MSLAAGSELGSNWSFMSTMAFTRRVVATVRQSDYREAGNGREGRLGSVSLEFWDAIRFLARSVNPADAAGFQF